MKILVLNSGSSSLKFQLFEIKEKEHVLIKGIADGIGLKDSFILYEIKNKIKKIRKRIKNHKIALKNVLDIVLANNIISSFNEIKAIGHRAVHGGEDFKEPVLVNDKVIKKIDELSEGFVYCVSVTGTTGVKNTFDENVIDNLKRTYSLVSKNKMLIGFGISKPEDVKTFSPYCDGVIVGSAVIKIINESNTLNSIAGFIKSLSVATIQ